MTHKRGVLPTLTEVIEGAQVQTAAPAVAAASDDAAALTAEILDALQPRIDALLEARLREALAPQLARLADGAVRGVRLEIAASLQTLVAQAVADALARRRTP